MTKPGPRFWVLAAALTAAAMAQTVFNPQPARVVGHFTLTARSGSPNLVEGRELYWPQSATLDFSLSPPALYVADTLNHRVLGWRNALQFGNGAYADIVIGQPDRFSTSPGTSRTALAGPVAVAVDAQGNLYVADAGNNRILRFPKPFQQLDQGGSPVAADFVIGQPDFSSNRANRGGSPSAATVALATASRLFPSALVFDAAGNLWFSDAGNSRVLRYPADALRQGALGPAADLVLGQENFSSGTALGETAANRLIRNRMRHPSGLAFDTGGRLYVADALNRVLVFTPPFSSNMASARLMGIVVVPSGQQPPAVSDTALNRPEGVLMIGANPAVVDSGNHRILVFPRFEDWPPETSARVSPAAQAVLGQPDMNTARAAAGSTGLNGPVHAVFSGSELFVVDSNNHRVVVWPQQSGGQFVGANRVLGQISLDFTAPNLIEGRELFLTPSAVGLYAGAVALDNSSNPPRLYISDTFNNRILGYRDAFRVKPGDVADIVIGQPDRFRSTINYPSGDPRVTTRSSLYWPTGLAVDADGNLWVADSGNNRVLRFPRPNFDEPQVLPQANLVLGQADFFVTPRSTDPTRRTMAMPCGLAFTPEGHLLVADAAHHRVLLFRKPEGGDFANGMDASAVIGQPDFTSAAPGTAENRFNNPRGIAVDTSGRLYVADLGNNRISIFTGVAALTPGSDPRPVVVLVNSTGTTRLRSPYGVAVNQATGEIWVAELGASPSRLLRYPEYAFLPATNLTANLAFAVSWPLALALDRYGNPVVAEAINRVAMYYPSVVGVNAANYLERPLAPGTYVALYPSGGSFAFSETRVFDQEPNPIPMPKRLADVEVLINDEPVPLQFVSPRQINFLMPMNAPTSGSVSVLVQRPSTGQILGYGRLEMAPASPGLFTADASGSGQLAALNEDNTRNSASNAARRGSIIQLFATGAGFIPGAPPDGDTPGGRLIHTPERPRVFIGTDFVPDDHILYSGLAPGLIGVWQINVRIPDRVAPGNAVLLYVQYKDIPSMTPARRATIAVR
ncbi:MAG: hypothetical protein RMI94_02335 [Bryobacterales bacterium]|nr:hypothetical protein [Bryobacterales bacterium]